MSNEPRLIIQLILCFLIFQPAALRAEDEPLFGRPKTTRMDVVEKVLQANEFLLKSGERIWLIGIDVPEYHHPRVEVETDQYGFAKDIAVNPDTPIEERAFMFARKLLEG